MSTVQSTEHYEQLLAEVYDWMQGGWDGKSEQSAQLFKDLDVRPSGQEGSSAGAAVDLGAGTGYQTIPLAEMGFEVVAVDSSPMMLSQLTARAEQRGLANSITTVVGNLCNLEAHISRPPQLITCMGDTLSHLGDLDQVSSLVTDAHRLLVPGGKLVLSFRDGSTPPTGDGRFIPVRSDQDRIFTCFIEEVDESHLRIHDLVHQRGEAGFTQNLSSYLKLRVAADWLVEKLTSAGFQPPMVRTELGMTIISAER